jgi:hypothetical protein
MGGSILAVRGGVKFRLRNINSRSGTTQISLVHMVSPGRSDGGTGKVSDVKVNVKTDSKGRVSDVLVSKGGNAHKNHDHYYDKGKSGWGKSKKGNG